MFIKLQGRLIYKIFCRNYSNKPSYYHNAKSKPLIYRTIGQQLELSAEKFPNREILVSCEENVRLTYSEALNQADILASQFKNLGLETGDHIGIWSPNTYQWVISFMAAVRYGLTLASINPALQSQEVKFCLKKSKCKAIICPEIFKTQNYYEILRELVPEISTSKTIISKELPELRTIIVNSKNDLQGAHKFDNLFKNPKKCTIQEIKDLQNFIDPDSSCNIQFTSGTTGVPKAAVLTHFSYINNCETTYLRMFPKGGERILCQLPLLHVAGLMSLIVSISSGSTFLIPSLQFNSEKSLKAISGEKCTVILGTPTMLIDNIEKQKKLNLPIESLKIGLVGGAACSPQLYKDAKDILGLEKFHNGYGMSETAAGIFLQFGNESLDIQTNTVGKILDHLEAKCIDANGKTVEIGKPGELCIRGYCVMKQYYDDKLKTKEVLGSDGWLKTGDEFILDENGYAQIVGRKKDMIIRGGENIFPKQIEDFLNTHPDISETQVIGIPDERMGEEVCAFIRLGKDCSGIDEKDVKAFCKGKIAHYKIPKYIRFVEDFPKLGSGKIEKSKLLDIFKEIENNK